MNTEIWQYVHPAIAGIEILERNCPCCGTRHSISVDTEQFESACSSYLIKEQAQIQNEFSFLSEYEQEFLKTGICPECLNMKNLEKKQA